MNMQIRRDVILDTLMAAVNVLRQWKMNQLQCITAMENEPVTKLGGANKLLSDAI